MNNPSPLASNISPPDQRNKNRTRFEIAVFVVLAIHGVGLLALLMQGCQKPPEGAPAADTTGSPPAFVAPTNVPAPQLPTNSVVTTVAPTNASVAPAPPPEPPPAPPPAPQATEYAIAQGDTFSALAKKFGVKVKAIEEANPGVDPAKLRIGQKIHIPPPPAVPTPAALTMPPESAAGGGEQIYVVKSGDMLSTIAKSNGVTVKALRAANDLKTDRITVGQKLKIPPRTASVPAPMPDASATNSAPTGR